MKNFTQYVLATIVGIIATVLIIAVLGIMSVVGMVASTEKTQSAPKNSVMVLNLNGIVNEQAQEDVIGKLTGNTIGSTGLNDVLTAIEKAKDNDNIKGIYFEVGMFQAGYATLQEIRNALLDFKKSKKWIVAYGEQYTQGAYYLASVADKVYVNPSGMIDIHGIASQQMYLRDLYAKFGIHYQILKVGKYKSATEIYSEDHMSDANREQITAYVNGLWSNITKEIAASRKMTVQKVNDYADQLTMAMDTKELKKAGFVDGILYNDEVKGEIKKLLSLEEDDDINQLSISQMLTVRNKKKEKGGEIAVYYASGEIVDSPLTGFNSIGSSQIVGSKMCKDIEELMNDDDIKAVVIRVNSPGGSAYASEQIWHQVTKLKEMKPVVVSMGDYAASGGYYISCNANWIVAQPTTLTGSIGIFGVIPEASELLKNKLGLHFDEVKTNRHSTMGSAVMGFPTRPFDAEETEIMQNYINRGYALFRKRVADGRKQKVEQIEEIAQGHVWLGQDAIGIRLVDEIGGLNEAIAKAAKLADLKDYYTTDYPAVPSFLSQLLDETENAGNNLDEQLKMILGEWYLPYMYMKSASEQSHVQAALPFVLDIR